MDFIFNLSASNKMLNDRTGDICNNLGKDK